MAEVLTRDLERFGYPSWVTGVIRDAVNLILDALGRENTYSVLLLGSASRGEFSYGIESRELFSDLEFLVVTQAGIARDRIKWLRGALESRFRNASKLPLFHVDVTVMERPRVRRLRPIVRWFEAASTGLTLFGNDIRLDLPKVTPASIDLVQTAELILIRYWNLLIFTPKRVATREAGPLERMVFQYVVARNALDIATILFPFVGELVPTYSGRLSALPRVLQEHPEVLRYFRVDLKGLLERAYAIKLEPENLARSVDPYVFLEEVLEGYANLIGFIVRQPVSREQLSSDGDRIARKLSFQKGRRAKWLLYYVALQLCQRGRLTSWVWRRKWEPMLWFAHLMLEAVVEGNQTSYSKKLAQAWNGFAQTKVGFDCWELPASWSKLRRNFLIEGGPILRIEKDKIGYFERVVEWENA